MDTARIVITGIGVVGLLGIGKDNFSEALFKGTSGIKPISLFDISSFNWSVKLTSMQRLRDM